MQRMLRVCFIGGWKGRARKREPKRSGVPRAMVERYMAVVYKRVRAHSSIIYERPLLGNGATAEVSNRRAEGKQAKAQSGMSAETRGDV